MRRSPSVGIVVVSTVAGFLGGLAASAFHASAADTHPPFTQALPGTTDAKIQSLEARSVQFEQKLAALKTAYEKHEHSYIPPVCSARFTLRTLKQTMDADPDNYTVCLGTRDFPGGHMAATTKPNP